MDYILFSQVREDPSVEMEVIRRFLKPKKAKIILVGSGGCTVLSLLSLDNVDEIHCVDMSESQLRLIRLKIAVICYFMEKETILKFFHGDDPKIIETLEDLEISKEDKQFWRGHNKLLLKGINQSGGFEVLFQQLVASGFDFDTLFDRKALISIFGESAVVNSLNKEFSDHFRQILTTYETLYRPEDNYFYHQILYNRYHPDCLPPYFDDLEAIQTSHSKIKYHTSDFVKYISKQPDRSHDFVQTSNLTDWMSHKELHSFLQDIHRVLKPGGYVVMRRLNGDYDLEKVASTYFSLDTTFVDRSHFYSQIVVGKVR